MTEIYAIHHAGSQQVRYTHDQWVKRNGSVGAAIVAATATDSTVNYLYQVMRQAEYITPDDPRLAAAYGYFAHKGICTLERAEEICGCDIVPLTEAQLLSALDSIN